jgi:hypothetical protein
MPPVDDERRYLAMPAGDDPLSPAQLTVLRGASPEELSFLIWYARAYVGGRKIACWGARGFAALGILAGAAAAFLALFSQIRGLPS